MFLINNFYTYILVPTLIIFLLQFLSFTLYKKKFSKIKLFFANNLLILILITVISNITQLILLLDEKFFLHYKDNIIFFLISIIFLTPLFILIKKRKDIKYYLRKKLIFKVFEKKIYLSFLILFLSSIGILSDADSLIYNSKISKIILEGFSVSYFIDNIHISLLGVMEIFNVYQEILGVSNLNRLFNIFFLVNFLLFILNFNKDFKNQKLFFLSILSVPVLTIIFSHEKTFFMPLIVQLSIFIYLLIKKEILNNEKSLIISGIICTCLFKLSFLISGFVLFVFLFFKFFKSNINLDFFKIIFYCFLFFGLPHLFFKIYHFGNPFNPFLGILFTGIYNENINTNFSIYLKNWSNSGSLSYPLNLFLPGILSKIHNILGLGFIIVLFIKNLKSKINLQLFFVFFLSLILIIIFSQNSPRFYLFPLMVLMVLLLVNEIKYKKFLKIIFLIQFVFTMTIMSLMIPVTISTSWLGKFSENYKNKFIFRHQINKEIEKIIGINKYIITDIPNYYSKNFDISLMIIFFADNDDDLYDYKNLLNSTKIEYLVTTNQKIEDMKFLNTKKKKINNFLNKCFNKPAIKVLSLDVSNRKKLFINHNKKNNFYIYKIQKRCTF
jgi:hypothetical protein